MLNRPIAVLGGGNCGHAMAADLTLAGFDIHLYEHPSFKEQFRSTLETEQIKITGIHREGNADIRLTTLDIGEALEGVELINIAIPATGHETFFQEMIPHLKDGQTIVVWSGRFGSLLLWNMLKGTSMEGRVTIAEANTLPYGARLIGPSHVHHHLTATRVHVAGLPATETARLIPELKSLYEMIVPAQNVIAAALANSALITFPPVALLNAGRIEYSEGDFHAFKEGVTKSVSRVIKGVDHEFKAVGKAWGIELPEYNESDYGTPASLEAVEFKAPTDTFAEFARMRGPTSVPHRFFTENIGHGHVTVHGLALKAEVPTPLIYAIVQLGSILCDEDYWNEGRNLKRLGLQDLTKHEILAQINKGVN